MCLGQVVTAYDDAYQDAVEALLDSANRYKKGSNAKFSTYAYGKIDNAVKNRAGVADPGKRKAYYEGTKAESQFELDKPSDFGDAEVKGTQGEGLLSPTTPTSQWSKAAGDLVPDDEAATSFYKRFGKDADVAQVMAERASISRGTYKDVDGKTKRHKIPSDTDLAKELGMSLRAFKLAKKRVSSKVEGGNYAQGGMVGLLA